MTSVRCELCGCLLDPARDLCAIEAEAETRWGVKKASTDPHMMEICEPCFQRYLRAMGKEPKP